MIASQRKDNKLNCRNPKYTKPNTALKPQPAKLTTVKGNKNRETYAIVKF